MQGCPHSGSAPQSGQPLATSTRCPACSPLSPSSHAFPRQLAALEALLGSRQFVQALGLTENRKRSRGPTTGLRRRPSQAERAQTEILLQARAVTDPFPRQNMTARRRGVGGRPGACPHSGLGSTSSLSVDSIHRRRARDFSSSAGSLHPDARRESGPAAFVLAVGHGARARTRIAGS